MKEVDIIERYEEWDPDEETVADFVNGLGVSRQRLYAVLQRHGVTPKTRRNKTQANFDSGLTNEMAEMALGFLVNQLQEARNELAQYRTRYGALDEGQSLRASATQART